jgi:hypothetical protein
MKNEFTNWWAEIFRWLITLLIFAIYTALTFFSLDGDWSFLTRFGYWFDLFTSTTLAWFLRYLWTFKGLEAMLFKSVEIKEQEQGKADLIMEINSKNLTDVLEHKIEVANTKEKKKQYRIKCDRKIRKHWGFKKLFKKWHEKKADYWKQERIDCDNPEFDIDAIKVKYYKYDIDSMLTSTYRPSHEVEVRGNIGLEIVKSFRISIITMIVFAVLGAIQIWLKDYSNDDLVILGGKLLMFLINMYSGYDLGGKFIKSKYSNDLTKDYVFMKSIIKGVS